MKLKKPRELPMNDGEIRASYRQAKDPADQLHILAELNACDVSVICDIVGVEPPKKRAKSSSGKYGFHRWTEEDYAILRNMIRSDYSNAEIAEVIGVSTSSVAGKIRKKFGDRAAVGSRQKKTKNAEEIGEKGGLYGKECPGWLEEKTRCRGDRCDPEVCR